MILGISRARFAPVPDHGVVGWFAAYGSFRGGEIRDAEQKIALFGVEFGGKASQFLHLVGETLHLGFKRGGVASRFPDCADLLAETVLLGAEILDAGLGFASAGIAGKDLIHQVDVIAGTGAETGLHRSRILAEKSDIKHPKSEK
jgi:hypothetical protein